MYKVRSHVVELLPAELKEHKVQVLQAKMKEIASWLEHAPFCINRNNQCGSKPVDARWVVPWNLMHGNTWTIKARLVVKGYQDPQGRFLETSSPKANRTSQRVLVSVSVRYKWHLVSLDIGTAFLQGAEFSAASTTENRERKGYMKPPKDVWELLADTVPGKPKKLPQVGEKGFDWIWRLQKEVYGVKDAPQLWFMALLSFPFGFGFVASTVDPLVLYMRKGRHVRWSSKGLIVRTGFLIGMVTAYVGDLGCTGEPLFLEWLHAEAEKRFGKVRREEKGFLHVVAQYHEFTGFSITQDLCGYVKLIEPATVPKNREVPLESSGLAE